MQNLSPEWENRPICHKCIGDQVLAAEVRSAGQPVRAHICDNKLAALPLEDIALRIHGVMTGQFELTPNHPVDAEEFVSLAMGFDWDRKGTQAAELIAEIAKLEPQIANDVARFLSESFGWREEREGGEDPYGFEAHHEQVQPDTSRFKIDGKISARK